MSLRPSDANFASARLHCLRNQESFACFETSYFEAVPNDFHHQCFVNIQVTSLNSMSGTLEDALREYNETYATMDLVLFEDAMKHVRGDLRCHCIFSTFVVPYAFGRPLMIEKPTWHLEL